MCPIYGDIPVIEVRVIEVQVTESLRGIELFIRVCKGQESTFKCEEI